MFPGMTAVRGVFGVFQIFVRSHIVFLSSAGDSSGICVRSAGGRQDKMLSEDGQAMRLPRKSECRSTKFETISNHQMKK